MTEIVVSSAQFKFRPFDSYDEFMGDVENYIKRAAKKGSDFILFPELVTQSLLTIGQPAAKALEGREALEKITSFTPALHSDCQKLAGTYNLNIISGSHLHLEDGVLKNTSFLFHRDGKLSRQDKIHPTADERSVWGVQGNPNKGKDRPEAIDTDCGTIGIMICYDSEFPEIGRELARQGATLFFVPYCTETINGHLRVTCCTQARTVENQIYAVTAGCVGSLHNVWNMEEHYARSHILCPIDTIFGNQGVIRASRTNQKDVITTSLEMDLLKKVRNSGIVRNFNDQRADLYRVVWGK